MVDIFMILKVFELEICDLLFVLLGVCFFLVWIFNLLVVCWFLFINVYIVKNVYVSLWNEIFCMLRENRYFECM